MSFVTPVQWDRLSSYRWPSGQYCCHIGGRAPTVSRTIRRSVVGHSVALQESVWSRSVIEFGVADSTFTSKWSHSFGAVLGNYNSLLVKWRDSSLVMFLQTIVSHFNSYQWQRNDWNVDDFWVEFQVPIFGNWIRIFSSIRGQYGSTFHSNLFVESTQSSTHINELNWELMIPRVLYSDLCPSCFLIHR